MRFLIKKQNFAIAKINKNFKMLFYLLMAVHAENCDHFRQSYKINLKKKTLSKNWVTKYSLSNFNFFGSRFPFSTNSQKWSINIFAVGYVFSIVFVSLLPLAEFGPNGHREDASHFKIRYILKILVLTLLQLLYFSQLDYQTWFLLKMLQIISTFSNLESSSNQWTNNWMTSQ